MTFFGEPGPNHEEGLLADGWKPIRPGAFVTLIGPIYVRTEADTPSFCFRIQPQHDNTYGRPHGGMVMSFLDEALGLGTHILRPGTAWVTIGFECQFLDGSRIGELVEADTVVTRATSSLMFMRATCRVGDRPIAAATGIWKMVGQKRASPEG